MRVLSTQDLAPLVASAEQVIRAEQAASYWRGVLQRLAKNPRAVLSLLIIALLLLATLLGPWLWPVDPYQQALNRASLPSHGSEQALLLADENWQPPVSAQPLTASSLDLAPVVGLQAIDANTEWVRLSWQPVAGASHYVVYRHQRQPSNHYDLGLPLGQTRGLEHGFEDRLQLKAQRYFYSVVAVSASGRREPPATIDVLPQPAIALLDAQLQGLVSLDILKPSPGQTIRLPANPLGTDALGRDMLARLIHGARTSLFIGIVAPLAFVWLGVIYGALSGYLGGVVDNVMMRFADFVIALPFLLFMIVLKIAFGIGPGESGVSAMLVAMLLLSWPATARLVRAQVMQLKQQPFIESAKLSGAGSAYIIRRHMLPNILGVVLVALTFAIPSAIFTEAFLSFIGMGVVPPTPSWGAMSQDGMRSLLTHPHELLWPSLLISITVLAFNLLGDALRDALDVKLEQRL